ncbi:MAG: MBL fold metallo-hydrolase, partial [Bacteroidales bacterium]|nr:MBL fold metallo-hydrolase [Bacteroidales bacterium]MDD2571476.1 MBL fold metallo-hydrolase [Bacteroidales bacterium]MDD3385532.1 MBL fold metallo-hydrolase [Bacteroidales bacterium]MDD3872331.1 MBL fold metallo-hydrolase [Bacteroidales bacterium]
MKITILYDNTLFQENLKPDWGFSCLVEAYGKTILFDTGANGAILLENMEKLQISPSSIDDIFISHTHFDHIGGLSAFLNHNSNVTVFLPLSLRGVRKAKKVIHIDKPMPLYENFYSTGELENIEQAMAVKTPKGLVLIVGCSHPDMKNMMDAASQFGHIYAIVGGLHGFDNYELFKNLEAICPTHCTQHIAEIKALYPEKYIQGGV